MNQSDKILILDGIGLVGDIPATLKKELAKIIHTFLAG